MLRRRPSALDHETALRLVAGAVQPDDAPPGYGRVALLLSEAASTPPPVPAAQAAATVAAMVEAVRSRSPGKAPRFSRLGASGRSVSTKVTIIAGSLVLTAGGAAAATGSLPPSLQDATARVASYVGLNLPFPDRTDAGDTSSTDPATPSAPAGAGSAGAGHSQQGDQPAFDTVPASADNGPDAGSSSGPGQAVVSDGTQPSRPQSNKTGTRNRGTDPGQADTRAEHSDPGEPNDPRETEPAAPVEPKDPVEFEPPNPTEPRDPSEPHDPTEPAEGSGARGAFSPTTEDS
jgi:hypothetical protein